MRPTSVFAALAALALSTSGAGCNKTTDPTPSGEYTATIRLQETGTYSSGDLVVSPNITVTAYLVDSTYLVSGSPAGVLVGTLRVSDGIASAGQPVPTTRVPIPHYAGTITAASDSMLRLFVSGDTLTTDGLGIAVASFSVNFSGNPIVPRIVNPLPDAQLTPISGLTVRWSDVPSADQIEAAVVSSATPPESVVARGLNDQGFITFSKSQIASLPEGGATLRVTRSRTKTLSVPGLRGGTATVAATVRMPVAIIAPTVPHHGDDAR